jgi:hypothetical protein
MGIKYTNIFHLKILQNLPKLGFLFENIPSGNPVCVYDESLGFRYLGETFLTWDSAIVKAANSTPKLVANFDPGQTFAPRKECSPMGKMLKNVLGKMSALLRQHSK